MLGWRILKKGEYAINLPVLSKAEEELILATEERFKEATRLRSTNNKRESAELIDELLQKCAEAAKVYLERDQRTYLGRVATSHIYGYAFLDFLIDEPEVEEISVIGPTKPVYIYIRKEGWKQVNASFTDERTIAEVVNKMARGLGRHISVQNPRLDAMLPDGSRLHASLSPISKGEITIRKFRARPFSPSELIENKTIDIYAMALLSVIVQCDNNIVIAGNTASGKTTTLNALFSFIPANERVLIVEETPEINVPHEHQARIVANRDLGVNLKDLVYDSLRMRPDRLIVGEVRNKEEAEALNDVLLAGQARGSYATIHAQSSKEVHSRLRSFGINEEDLNTIDCIVVQRRMLQYDSKNRKNNEIRKVIEIAEADDLRANTDQNRLCQNGQINEESPLLGRCAQAFGMNIKELLEEIELREKKIAEAPLDYLKFYKFMQKELHNIEVGKE